MELKDLITIFNEVLNPEGKVQINAQTEFKELEEWSSLSAFTIVEQINEKFSVRIRGIQLRKCNNIEELFNLLNAK